jgi:carboxymethylenebutenolidase
MSRIAIAVLSLLAAPAFAEGHVHGGSDADAKVPAHQPHPVDPAVPAPTGKMIPLALPGGGTGNAYLAEPQGKPTGAVLVVHEWWGLNDHVKHEADLLAKQGDLALAVDLYGGKVAQSADEAGKLMGALDAQHAGAIEQAALEHLHAAHPELKIATLGWCMGGGEALHAALTDPARVSATVMYYGLPVDDVAQLKTLKGPLLGIWAKQDGWITPAKVQAFDKALTQAGVPHDFHSFDADHAFANPTGGKYNPPAAKEADALRDAFLAKNLAGK